MTNDGKTPATGTSLRTWKLTAISFAGVSAVLAVLLVLQASGRFDLLAALRGGGGGYAGGGGPAPVKVGEFKGTDAALSAVLKETISKRLAGSPGLSYSSPGVTGVVVGGSIKEAKVTPGAGGTEVAVKVSLYVTKEPGSGILSVLSSTAALETSASAPPGEIESAKKEALAAAADAAYEDFLEVIR